jgi:glycosyltransferase involved in cell wall biosynthesis
MPRCCPRVCNPSFFRRSILAESFPDRQGTGNLSTCGTPCVATDVGDAALIVANPEWMAPPRDSFALAACISKVLTDLHRDGRDAIGARCRERIMGNFSLERMIASYRSLWAEVLVQRN